MAQSFKNIVKADTIFIIRFLNNIEYNKILNVTMGALIKRYII
jgi:hypothetical protein